MRKIWSGSVGDWKKDEVLVYLSENGYPLMSGESLSSKDWDVLLRDIYVDRINELIHANHLYYIDIMYERKKKNKYLDHIVSTFDSLTGLLLALGHDCYIELDSNRDVHVGNDQKKNWHLLRVLKQRNDMHNKDKLGLACDLALSGGRVESLNTMSLPLGPDFEKVFSCYEMYLV